MSKKPYKTCRFLILSGPFPQNGSQKDEKSIRFFSKSWYRFTTLEKTKKALATQGFGAFGKVSQNALYNLSKMVQFTVILGKVAQKGQENH